MGPRESSRKGLIQLAHGGFMAYICPKNTHASMGVLYIGSGLPDGIVVMMYAVSSYCIHHLLEVQDDMFYIMCHTMPVGRNYQNTFPGL